jgi:hypothetical protein
MQPVGLKNPVCAGGWLTIQNACLRHVFRSLAHLIQGSLQILGGRPGIHGIE